MSDESGTPAGGEQLTKAERKKLRREEKARERERALRRKNTRRAVRWGALFVGIAVVVGGLVLTVGQQEQDGTIGSGTAAVAESDWTKGSREARAVLIEYGDFQCPACGAYFPVVKELSGELGDDVLIVYRHFPLRQSHPQAQLAAQATEAAGRQGKFWEMHDRLFERQREWSNQNNAEELFTRYAEELGLQRDQFVTDLQDGGVREAIEEDLRSGIAAGVDATPTFYLNGSKLTGFSNYDEFKERIRQAARNES